MSISPTLVIMAAGAARRYGGLKQLAAVGPAEQALMEYSIFDAKSAGFSKVVLVVRQEFEGLFREKFADQAADHLEIAFAHQEANAYVPGDYRGPERPKPWGTAHAVLCAKADVQGAFAVINADDFYGRGAFEAVAQYLNATEERETAAMVGYRLENTLSEHGTVNRGVCQVAADNALVDIVERFEIGKQEAAATYRHELHEPATLPLDTLVSMNLWGFQQQFLSELECGFAEFLTAKPDPSTEYELPTFIKHLMATDRLQVRVLPTNEKWCGMTYQDDLPLAQARLADLVERGVYPRQLWAK